MPRVNFSRPALPGALKKRRRGPLAKRRIRSAFKGKRPSDSAPDSKRVPSIQEQLRSHYVALRRRHGNLIGIGIGSRKRAGQWQPDIVIRLLVKKKIRPRGRWPAGTKPLSTSLPLWASVFGQTVGLMIQTDVDEVPRIRKMDFGIDGGQAGALAQWVAKGKQKLGVITCAHCLTSPGQDVQVAVKTGVTQAKVLVQANVQQTGIDVGLAELTCPPTDIADVGDHAAKLISLEELIPLLGNDPNDALLSPMRFWNFDSGDTLRGVAYYVTQTLPLENGQTLTLRDAIEVHAELGTFVRSLSGSPVGLTLPNGQERVVAMLSHANTQGSIAYGVWFRAALEWVRKARPALHSLSPFWSMSETNAMV